MSVYGEVSLKALLEAGVHFGHQTRRWNPKMKKFIFTVRNDIYIIDLQKTVRQIKRAAKFVHSLSIKGGKILMVSTKKQAQEIVEAEAKRGGMFFVNQRWLGGMLTNFTTISKRVRHLKSLQEMEQSGVLASYPKKEASKMMKAKARLEKYLGGIADLKDLPDAMYVIDPRREHIAVTEARKLGIPIIGIVDTNCDPDDVDIVIPGNDDAIRAIKLITGYLVDAMEQGLGERAQIAQQAEKEKSAAETEAREKGKFGHLSDAQMIESAPEEEEEEAAGA
ncbi:MAG: 30S ribosomal protein S2 [Candidatus Wallbacteria bacterium]|nr:30S ribosomal protein S2 [Candidatus Wallbacteria bacterium]